MISCVMLTANYGARSDSLAGILRLSSAAICEQDHAPSARLVHAARNQRGIALFQNFAPQHTCVGFGNRWACRRMARMMGI